MITRFTNLRAWEAAARAASLRTETECMGEGMTERDDEAVTYAFSGDARRVFDQNATLLGMWQNGHGVLATTDEEFDRYYYGVECAHCGATTEADGYPQLCDSCSNDPIICAENGYDLDDAGAL